MARGDANADGGRQISAGIVGLGIIAVLLVVFIVQNTDETPVTVLFWDVTAPLWMVLLGTAVVALVIAELAGIVRRRSRS